MATIRPNGIEARVTAVETGLDLLTNDVRELAKTVRTQGETTGAALEKLMVEVTKAASPKQTDWQTIFIGLSVLVTIIGAIFYILSERETSLAEYLGQRVQTLESRQNERTRDDLDELHLRRMSDLKASKP